MKHPPVHMRPVMRLPAAGALAFCLHPAASGQTAPATQSSGQTATDSRIDSLLRNLNRVRAPITAAISPDGSKVAWAVSGSRGSELHLTSIGPARGQTAESERVISPDTVSDTANYKPGECTASHPAWSPDGKQLAFLSNCSGSSPEWERTGQNNIFIWTMADNAMKQVSHLHGSIGGLQWSPDGKSIAFLYVENATRQAGALDAMKPWSGVYGEDGVEVQRVAAARVEDGKFFYITQPNLHVYEFAWGGRDYAVSGNGVTYVAAPPPGENNWWVAKLYTQPVCSIFFSLNHTDPDVSTFPCAELENPRVVFDPTTTPGALHNLQIAVPRFSPDGKSIAFIGGLMSDQGQIGGDVYLIPATGLKPGDQPQDITPNRPSTPSWITWLSNSTLGVSEHVGGGSRLTALDLHTGPGGAITATEEPSINLTWPETIIAGGDVMSVSFSSGKETTSSKTARIALIRQSFDRPPEVWAGSLNDLKQITHLNDDLKPAWGKAESIDYTNEGFPIQGWLLYPAGWTPNTGDPAKKHPLIVSVHGGPSGVATPRWPTVTYGAVPFSALGYFVFLPNPRGSYGQGEKFTQANIRDFGYGDLRDVLAGLDVLEKRFPIDKQREGITGWSYGGFMTMFAVTQTTRFRAAVAGAGISNWQSYYGENSIDQWMIPFFGTSVYDDPAIYAKSSAIDFIKRVKTPTLVVVGDRDGECPAPQSFEFWHALRDEGVKTQLVLYPNEGHHLSDPAHQRDVLKRALDWFQAEMPPD